jgi:hypothetical protein
MVYTHVLQFFSDASIFPSVHFITQFFNLITFSGFVFCFGYVNQLAYYSKPFSLSYKKMLITGLKTLIAFYISGVAFQLYVGNLSISTETIMPIILLQVIPGWSEFLVSFTLIIFIGLVLFPFFSWIGNQPVIIWGTSILLLATTWIDYHQVPSPYLGLLIGTDRFPTFPVIQYLPYYLIGMFFARYQIRFKWKYLLTSTLGTCLFISYLVVNGGELPGRFPPSVYWIVGPSFFLYIYYVMTKLLDKWQRGGGILRIMGENVLFYLLISNVFIFSLANVLEMLILGPWKGLLFTITLLLIITYFIKIITVKQKKSSQSHIKKGNKTYNQDFKSWSGSEL